MGKLTDRVAKGVFWVLMEKFGLQAVHFVVTLVLARLLTPNDYGTVALLSVFVSFSNVLVDGGLPKALMQKKKAASVDFNTVFYLSVTLGIVLYAVLFCGAPFVAGFYGDAALCPMLRVMALSLIFHSVNGVQNVELGRKMLFKLSFLISWPRIIVSSVVGIVLAVKGNGPWALVWSTFAGSATGVIARHLVIRWRPSLEFSWTSARELFSFGWKMAAAALVTDIYQNIYALIIGKFYTRTDLAFVRKGTHLPRSVRAFVTQALRRVSFPALVRLQDDLPRLRNAMRRLIACSSFCVFPVIAILAVFAEPLIEVLFGSRWLPAAPYARLACFTGIFAPFNAVNNQAITARGRSDLILKLVIFRRVVGVIIMVCALPFGVYPYMASVAFVLGPLGMLVTMWPNRRELGYTLRMQVADVLPAFMFAVAAALISLPVRLLIARPLWQVAVAVPLAGLLYLGLAYVFRARALSELTEIVLPGVEKFVPGLARVFGRYRNRRVGGGKEA